MRNVGVLIIRIVVGIGILYYNYNKDPQTSIGNHLGQFRPYRSFGGLKPRPLKDPEQGPLPKKAAGLDVTHGNHVARWEVLLGKARKSGLGAQLPMIKPSNHDGCKTLTNILQSPEKSLQSEHHMLAKGWRNGRKADSWLHLDCLPARSRRVSGPKCIDPAMECVINQVP